MSTSCISDQVVTAQLLEELNVLCGQQPPVSRHALAKHVCNQFRWYQADGKPRIPKARSFLAKLHRGGQIKLPPGQGPRAGKRRRLACSGQLLPAVEKLPARIDQVRGLKLYLLSGADDSLSPLWNDLIVQQHPLGDAPLVAWQLRYLIGSDHGWLGAIGFSSPAFHLQPRDQWIGWSPAAHKANLSRVIGLSRFLIRHEVRCANLASKTLAMALQRVAGDWQQRYGIKPLLVESFVDGNRYTGRCYVAANWQLIGVSQGRGRDDQQRQFATGPKDIYVFALAPKARQQLQESPIELVQPRNLLEGLESQAWAQEEMAGLDLGDKRLNNRAVKVLQGRWEHPTHSFAQSFGNWGQAHGSYRLIEHESEDINLNTLLAAHQERTLQRMAAESVVLLPQDTTSLNYGGLKKTEGLGYINHEGSLGLHLHSTLALTQTGVPLGVIDAQCWARQRQPSHRGRNAKSVDEKESVRWVKTIDQAAVMARRMPQTRLVVIGDRESDIYEVFDHALLGPENLSVLVRAQHNRNLEAQSKLWEFMAQKPVGQHLTVSVPRRGKRCPHGALLELRWAEVTICSSEVRIKRHWSGLKIYAVWAREVDPPDGEEPLEWMLLTDQLVSSAEQAEEKVRQYCSRWRIEEWHRVLKTGCRAEKRECERALHLQRVLAFDLIVAWRVLMLVKLNRETPNLPAETLFSQEELEILQPYKKKDEPTQILTVREATHRLARLGGALMRKRDGEPGAELIGQGFTNLALLVAHKRMEKQSLENSG